MTATESKNSKPAAVILHEMASIRNYLVAAQDVVRSGHMPDMTGLENRVASLCESIQKAPSEVQAECLPQLHELLAQLGSCEEVMRGATQSAESIKQ